MELHVSLVGRRDLAGEIYRQLREAILEGRLRPGDPLPASRSFADRLSVSRTTVVDAYERLGGDGLVTSRVGAGTFVSEDVPVTTPQAPPVESSLRPREVWGGIPLATVFAQGAEFDFRTGLADSTLFPFESWRRLVARELRPSAVGAGVYGDPAGHGPLREAIARHVAASRGLAATPDDVTVTNGTQQALDIVARVLLEPGDRVAVEDPGYQPPRRLFESLGLTVTGVPVDDEGLVVDALPTDARLVYVTPSHQYPLGCAMSLPRRTALLDWARRRGAAIVEDDYDSEFRFGDRPLEPLHTLDTTGQVVYVGSFSKTLLATLRLGFLVTPATLRHAVHAAKYVTDWHTPLLTQAVMARFIDEGLLAGHIRKARTVYEQRHQLIVATLADQFDGLLTLVPSTTGLHVSALTDLPADTVADAARRAATRGVAVQALSRRSIDRPPRSGLTLGYGAIDTAHIPEGLRRLRRAFDTVPVS